METKKLVFICSIAIALTSCSTGNCRSHAIKAEELGPALPPKENKLLPDPGQSERVRVFKANGSLQCSQGKSITPAAMEKDLNGIRVYKSSVENDGKLRVQMCGSPTGNVNVFEIDKANLAQAISNGFIEWIR